MTLPSAIERNDYVGNSTASAYSYAFMIMSQAHLTVIVRTPAGAEITLVIETDYLVTGVGSGSGGVVTLIDAEQSWLTEGNLSTGYALSILRIVPVEQNTSIRNQGDYYPEVVEDQFDYLTMIDQQQQDQIDRSFKLPVTVSPSGVSTTLPTPEASSIIGWDNLGENLENYTIDELAIVNNQSLAALQGVVATKSPVGAETQFTVADNQAAAANVTGLLFDYTVNSAAIIYYTMIRTDGTTKYRETGFLTVDYDGSTWSVEKATLKGSSGPTTGVAFSMSAGQLQYTSDAVGGTYSGKMRFAVDYLFLKET